MKLFFKHIFRTLREHPTQPILIILIVSLCVGVISTAVGLQGMFVKRGDDIEKSDMARGDIIVTLSGESEERMLFSDDAERLLHGRGEVFGDYLLAGIYDGKSKREVIKVSGADLERADGYFDFDFYEYGEFTKENLPDSCVISKAFAEKHDLHIGSTVTSEILGQKVTYTVQAVADDEVYFEDCEILIDIGGAVKLLARLSPAIAILGDGFAPSSRILIRAGEGVDTQALYEEISGSSDFSDDYVRAPSAEAFKNLKVISQNITVAALALAVVALCAVVIVTSYSFLAVQREVEYALFEASGASRKHVASLMTLESVIYGLLGGALGVLYSPLMFRGAASVFSWYDGGYTMGLLPPVIGFFLSFALILGCAFFSLHKKKNRKIHEILAEGGYTDVVRGQSKRTIYILCVLVLAAAICAVITPVKYRYILILTIMGLGIILIYMCMPALIGGLCGAAEKMLARTKKAPVLLLSVKNIKNSYAQKHTGRLMVMLFALVLEICLCVNVASVQERQFEKLITGDFMAVGLSESKKSRIRESGEVQGVADIDFYTSAKLCDEYSVIAVAVDSEVRHCVSDFFLPKSLPKSGNITVSRGLAILCGLKVGDKVPLEVDGNTYIFTVSEIQDAEINLVTVNSADVHGNKNLTVISLEESADKGEFSSSLEADGVSLVGITDIVTSGLFTLQGFLSLGMIALAAAMAVSVIGFANMLSEQACMRKRERELLTLSGMTRSQYRGMWRCELTVLLGIALALGTLCGTCLFALTNLGTQSFGVVLM